MADRQVIVIGGGPGGYVAAIRAAQLGGSVTLIERERLGGTCLNAGCIPTKALLHCAQFAQSAQEAARCGVHLTLNGIDWGDVTAYKNSVVRQLVGGVEALMRSNRITVIKGTARFFKPKALEIELADQTRQILEADKIIIATGAVAAVPPIEGLRESKYVIDSAGALSLAQLPASLTIIGGGVIGVELACAFHAMGCKTTIVEALPRLVPALDYEMSDLLCQSLKKQGIGVLTDHKVVRVADGESTVTVTLSHDGIEKTIESCKLLVAVGRRPDPDSLNVQAGNIKTERGGIVVNEQLETSVPGVYAIGDCLGKTMLAHTASAQGELAAENALGKSSAYRPAVVPYGIYTFPEMAGAGMTEQEAAANNIPFHIGRFPLAANGRSLILNRGEGLVKVLVGDGLGEVLGVHILGPGATELAGEAAMAISLEATADEIIRTIHAHPTVTEALREAVLAAEKRAIHVNNKRK